MYIYTYTCIMYITTLLSRRDPHRLLDRDRRPPRRRRRRRHGLAPAPGRGLRGLRLRPRARRCGDAPTASRAPRGSASRVVIYIIYTCMYKVWRHVYIYIYITTLSARACCRPASRSGSTGWPSSPTPPTRSWARARASARRSSQGAVRRPGHVRRAGMLYTCRQTLYIHVYV